MAYRDAVEHLEEMDPAQVDMAAEDVKRVVRLIKSALPELTRLPGRMEWVSVGWDLCERRLSEVITLVEALHDGFDQAGSALDAYTEAQESAKARVADGVEAETRLGRLIEDIVRTQSLLVKLSDPLRQWNDLRRSTSATDWLIEILQQDQINAVRVEAETLWDRATSAYDQAIGIERQAREAAVRQLDSAYRSLPDFLANSPDAARIIATTPGLRVEAYQAAGDPNARRPPIALLHRYQVQDDPHSRRYPDGWRAEVAELFGHDVEAEALRQSEAAILDELNLLELRRFGQIRDEAFAIADGRFPSVSTPARNDDHNDAFRHAYWNALLAREFGADWALRYATAHEAVPDAEAAREAMDLHNNEVGRSIAAANPDASPEELADLVSKAVREGNTVVINVDGELAYSDQLAQGTTGHPDPIPLPGHPQPEGTS